MHAQHTLSTHTAPGQRRGHARISAVLLACTLMLGACGGGGGGGGGSTPVDTGDQARRVVLADIGGEVILPAIEGFTPLAQQLQSALDNYAADLSSGNRDAARTAWASAMAAFSRIEVMQLGPAAADSQMGGENLRDLIYFWPSRNECLIDNAAYSNSAVNQTTRADSMGLGAIEYLLWFEGEAALYNPRLRRRYSVVDGIPVMLVDEAETVDDVEHGRLVALAESEGIRPTFGD